MNGILLFKNSSLYTNRQKVIHARQKPTKFSCISCSETVTAHIINHSFSLGGCAFEIKSILETDTLKKLLFLIKWEINVWFSQKYRSEYRKDYCYVKI